MMHDARQAFIKSESDKKLRQALWHQVRTSSEVRYVADDKVLQVMNRKLLENPQVLLKHGSTY